MSVYKQPTLDDIVGQLQDLPRRAVRLLAKAADLEDKLATRLIRRYRKKGKDWYPSSQFADQVHSYSRAVCNLSKELRELNAVRDAASLSDKDIQSALREVAADELNAMPDEAFMELVRKRAGVPIGEGEGDGSSDLQ